ncbi:flagellar protein FlaG [Planococcaceae bacterium Storch 2/2-2]|nr:flagellar protein FlaG [Planococcaceae bacterium Storch 2/2-2]
MVNPIQSPQGVQGGPLPIGEGDAITEVERVFEDVQAKGNQDEQLSKELARQMTDGMNRFLQTVDTQLRFKYHDKLNEYYVTIVDSKTDKVVREIPSKKLMDIHAAMREFIGLLVDRKI